MDSSVTSSTVITSSSSFTSNASKSTANGGKSSVAASGRVTHVEDINDENLLREMWVEALDGESKRQIRSRMYKIREERLKDFYNREGILENILKEEHGTDAAAVGEKAAGTREGTRNGKSNGTVSTTVNGNGNTTTTSSKTVTTTVGSASGGGGGIITTTTSRTTSSTLTNSGTDNDDGVKDLKSRINHQKEKFSVSRKQSQEQQAKTQTLAQKIKSTATSAAAVAISSVVSKKNSNTTKREHEAGTGSGDVLEIKSKQSSAGKASGICKSSVQRVESNKLSVSNGKAANGHSEIIARSSRNNESLSSTRNGHADAKSTSVVVTATTTKAEVKSKLSSSSVETGQSNKQSEKPPLVKKSSSSLQKDEVHRTASSSVRKGITRTSSSNSTSAVNSIKLAKGLHSPPVAKKETKASTHTEKASSTTPRFMSTTKSREIGIASTQQQFPTINVHVVHRQESGKGSSKVNVSLSNEATKKDKPLLTPKHSTGGEGRATKSRESSPQTTTTRSVRKAKEEKVTEKAVVSKRASSSSQSSAALKKHVAIKATPSGSCKTDESIIRELDNLDNYLYHRSKSIEDKRAVTPSAPAPIIDGESEMTRQRKLQRAESGSKAAITVSGGTEPRQKRNNSGGTQARQIGADENDAITSKGVRKSHPIANNAPSGAVDVMVSGAEPKVTKSRAFSHCAAEESRRTFACAVAAVDDGDIHGARAKEARSNGSNNAERRERNDETKSNTRSDVGVLEIETEEKVKGELLVSSSNNGSAHIKTEDSGEKSARYKKTLQTDEMSQAETQTAIQTGAIESRRETTATERVWSDAKMQSQQEKYDADILSRPSVFDKRKFNESGPAGPAEQGGRAAGQTLARDKERTVEQRQHKISEKETRKDYNDNEKKKTAASGTCASATDEDEDDNPLKPERRFSGQRRNLESPGAVLKAKSLFENKAHEASLDKPSGGFTLSPGTSFRVNRKAAIFEAKSRGERLSVSSESSSHVDGGNEAQPHAFTAGNEVTQMAIESESGSSLHESKKTVVKSTKSSSEFNADCPTQSTSNPRRRSSADMLEAIEDVKQLEAMLDQATDYDERSRIRARIRTIKRQTNLGKGTTTDAREQKTSASTVRKVLNGSANEDIKTYTKQSYVSRKSSEEIKTLQRKRSAEAAEQETSATGTVRRKSASRKSSGEITMTKESAGGVSVVAVETKRSQSAPRKLSGEIKPKTSETSGNGESPRPGSPKKDSSCFERLYATATVSSANMFSEAAVNNHPPKSGTSVPSPKSLSRKSSEKEDVVEPERATKQRQQSVEKTTRKISAHTQNQGVQLNTATVTEIVDTAAGSGKRRRYSSNKSTEGCAIHGSSPVPDEGGGRDLRRTPSVEKSGRRPSGSFKNEDAEVLTLDQLKDIQSKLRESASAEKKSAVARKISTKKEEVEKPERRLSKKESAGDSKTTTPDKEVPAATARKTSTEEQQKSETSSGKKVYTVRKSSSKELKLAAPSQPQEKSKTPERKKSGGNEKPATNSVVTIESSSSKSVSTAKSSSASGNFGGRRPSNGSNKRSALPVATETNTNSVTSSYGVGPVDDDGTPLFGLRALRKIKQVKEQQHEQENTIASADVSHAGGAPAVDMRRSDLYGLRALKKSHDVETDASDESNVVATKRLTSTKVVESTMSSESANNHVASELETDALIANVEGRRRSPDSSNADTKQSSPTPPPTATSPKSILKKTSSFSSNKSESKPDLNSEQKQSLETGTINSTFHSVSRLDSPSVLHSTRSRSSSSDDDWKRRSSDAHGSNSMTNLSSNALSNLSTFSRGRVGHSSVKEMSKRFEKTEASVDGVVSSKAEHSTRHVLGGPNKDLNGSEPEAGDTERGNVVYTKHSRIQKVELKGSDENDDFEDEFKEEIGGEVNEENGTIVKVTKNTTTTRSFLSDHSPATNLADVLERMKGEQQQGQNGGAGSEEGGEQGDSEAAGRNLLNKFIGAQILLAGVEPLLKASVEDTDTDRRTTTTSTMSHSLVINGVDIDQEADSDKLRRLLEGCDGAEERGRIERRLKTLGSSVAEVGASSSKVVRSSSKQSSTSADVTGELMPLILGQLQNSLHNLNTSGSAGSLTAGNDEPVAGSGVAGGGTAKTLSSSSLLDAAGGSGASSLCNSNNNSSATLVVQTPGTEGDGGAGSGGSPDEDECLFDSGTESGEDAPPVSSTNRPEPPPSSSLSMLSSSTSSNAATNPNKLASGKQNTAAAPARKSEPQAEFRSFMEGLRHSLQQSASALVLSSVPPADSKDPQRKGKGISIGGGRTSTGVVPSHLTSSSPASAAAAAADSDLIQQVDSVLSLLKDSLIKDPNYLEKKLSSSIAVDSRKGKELIALIDRLKSSLNSTKQETSSEVQKSTADKRAAEEPKPPDLLLPLNQALLSASQSKTTKAEEKGTKEQKESDPSSEAGKKQPPKPPTSLMDEVPWKIRAAKKRTQQRSRSIGVSHEELEAARRFLQEEAFRSALKSEERPESRNEDAGPSGQQLKAIPGFRPMGWKSDSSRPASASGPGDSETVATSLDDAAALLWAKFGVFKPHKPFRTLSLDNQGNNNMGEADYDPSTILFTPQEVAQIAIHRAAINKQMSEEEDRRRRRNSASSLQAALEGEPQSPNKPRDFSLALPKPYTNPNTPTPAKSLQAPVSVSSKSATPQPVTTDDEQGRVMLYDTSSTRSTPTPMELSTKRSSIDNVQISLKELTSNMFPQLQIAITLNTNNGGGNGQQQQQSGSTASTPPTPTNSTNMLSLVGASAGSVGSAPSTRVVTATPTSSSSLKGNVSSGSSSGNSSGNSSTRYKNKSERRRRMKRANTIDIPQPYEGGVGSEEEGDGEDEDDEPETPKFSPPKPNPFGSHGPAKASPSSVTAFSFVPKTESDKKFYAFLEKNSEGLATKAPGRFNRPLSHLAVPDDHRTSHFSHLKTSFESSTSQGSSPSMSPSPLSPSAKASHGLVNPEDILSGRQQQFSSKPIWAAKSDTLLAKSPQSVKNKLQVFEGVESGASTPSQDPWKSSSPENTPQKMGYQPQSKPSSLLAKKESFEKFVEENTQPVIQRRPVPLARTKVRYLPRIEAPKPESEPPPLPPPPLPPKTGVHIVHATKSAMDALARQRSNFSPIGPSMSASDQPPVIPPRASHAHVQFKSLPGSPTVEKPEMQWHRAGAVPSASGPMEPVRTSIAPSIPPFTNPKVQMSRELFESKQREAVLTPIPHPPPTSHINVTVPLHQQQKSFPRLDLPSSTSRSFEDEGVPLTGRSPFIAVRKVDGARTASLPTSQVIPHQSSHSPSPGGQVEKVSVVFQPIVHGKSLDSASGGYSQVGNFGNQQLHPKLAVFGVIRSIDDDRVVKGRLELESSKQPRQEDRGDENYGSQGIMNTAFAPSKTSAFVARRFENKSLEPLPQLRRSSTPVITSESQLSPGSPGTLISPVVSKVMKGPQQQRATVTRREMSSLGADHPSAHRIRGEAPSIGGSGPASTSNMQAADTARVNIKSILGQFQQAAETSTAQPKIHKPSPNAVKVLPGTLAPGLPLKKSHSGDALLQTHYGPTLAQHHHGHSGRMSHFISSAIHQEQEEPVPQSQTGKFQPFQAQGFVQARSRFLEQQTPTPAAQPQPQTPVQKPVVPATQTKSWVPQAFAGAVAKQAPSPNAGNPFIPRQRSLSHFPPSAAPSQQATQLKPATTTAQAQNKQRVLSSYGSVSSPSLVNQSQASTVNRIRFPPQNSQSLEKDERAVVDDPSPSVQEIVDQIQRTSSGSSIFDRTKSLYLSTQDSLGGGPKPKRRPPPTALPKSRTLFPKQYEAQMSPESAEKKQRELEAFFKSDKPAETKPKGAAVASTSAQSHYRKLRHQKSHDGNESSVPSYATRIRKSASQGKLVHRQRSMSDGEEDVDQIFESLFSSAVESKKGRGGEEMTTVTASAVESRKQEQSEAQCKVQSKASASTSQSSGVDGALTTKTVKQQSTKSSTSFKSASSSSTASATTSVSASSSASASPFSKFKQLDQQNSPSTAAANKGGGPIFKFTNDALKSSATSAKDVLLYWCQCRVRDYQNVKIENFSSSWSDGLAFCALIHHFFPEAFDYSKLEAKNRRHNFELAFRVAEQKADIYPILDVEDMMVMGKRPDWKCVFTYVQSMHRKLKDM